MATTTGQAEQRPRLHCVSWQAYQAILAALPDRRLRHTYDRGEFEMMSTSREHERIKRLIGRMIESLSFEMNVPIMSIGSSTLNKEQLERGLEPDERYYVASEARVRGRDDYNPDLDPPPDLAVEVDVTTSSVPRMPVYAALGVPEVWRYRRGVISFHVRVADDRYAEADRSVAFPLVQPGDIQRFLAARHATDETTWARSFAAWVRQSAGLQ